MQEELGVALPGGAGALPVLVELRVLARRHVAGAEALGVRLDDEDLHVVVVLGETQGLVERPHHVVVLEVRLLGPIQDQAGDPTILLLVDHAAQVLGFHGTSLVGWMFRRAPGEG